MDRLQRLSLKQLQHSDNWEALLKFSAEFMDSINDLETVGNNEFEVLKNTFIKEGKKQGIKEFLSEIEDTLKD